MNSSAICVPSTVRPIVSVPSRCSGYPLGDEADEHDAQQVLESTGLSYLASRWLLTLDGRPEPVSVEIVEASPERLRVKNVDYGYEADIGRSSSSTCRPVMRSGGSKAKRTGSTR